MLTGKGPSKRHEIFYFGGAELGAVRIDNFKFQFYDQSDGWPGPKVSLDMPLLYNIQQDPFERTPTLNLGQGSGDYMNGFYAREFWRFVFVQDVVAKLGETAINYPPMQDPASFNLAEVKRKIEAAIKANHGQ